MLTSLLIFSLLTHDAQEPAAPSAEVVINSNSPRLRFGIGGALGAGGSGGSQGTFGFGLGLALDLGVQFNDRSAFYWHSVATTLVYSAFAETAVVYEHTWNDVSLGAGVGWTLWGTAFANPGRGGLQIPLIFGWHPLKRRENSSVLSGFALNVELGLSPYGVQNGQTESGISGALTAGWVLR